MLSEVGNNDGDRRAGVRMMVEMVTSDRCEHARGDLSSTPSISIIESYTGVTQNSHPSA